MFREIDNSFQSLEGYNCFACGPEHPFGLRLRFQYDDDSNEVLSVIQPDRLYAGFPGILHGGLQATILDELAFWGTWARYGRTGFTYDMSLKFKRKCPVEAPVQARGTVGDLSHRLVECHACLLLPSSGKILTEGTIRYYLPDGDPRTGQQA